MQSNGVGSTSTDSLVQSTAPRIVLGSEHNAALRGVPALLVTSTVAASTTTLYRFLLVGRWCADSMYVSDCHLRSAHFYTEVPSQQWMHVTVRWYVTQELTAALYIGGHKVEERALDTGMVVSDWLNFHTLHSHCKVTFQTLICAVSIMKSTTSRLVTLR